MKKKYYLITLLFVIMMVPSFYVKAQNISYNPLEDGLLDEEAVFYGLKYNPLYKKWCEETFVNGKDIYYAYRDIAFNVKYTPEPPKTDKWQTPYETEESKKGDCEDAVFLFFSHLSDGCNNAKIVWGWVVDRQERIARAHVWWQITDKEGKEYVVEGFTDHWNGIIPMSIIKKNEIRKPILEMTYLEASRLLEMISRPNSWNTYELIRDLHSPISYVPESYVPEKNDIKLNYSDTHIKNHRHMYRKFDWAWGFSNEELLYKLSQVDAREIRIIFKKLYEFFTKYDMQS